VQSQGGGGSRAVPRIVWALSGSASDFRRLEGILDLRKEFEREMDRLRRSAYRTEDYQEQVRQVFQSRLQELLERTINGRG